MQKRLTKLELHQWKKYLLISDKFLFFLAIFLFLFFKPDLVLIVVYIFIFPYALLTKRNNLINHLLLSTLMAFLWVLYAKDLYQYNQSFISILSIDLYPLFAWSLGLFFSYTVYSHYEHKFHKYNFQKKLLIFSLAYIIILIFVETTAYHLFDIKNLLTSNYSGLPICNCIHAPIWMQISYFMFGPIFFTLSYLLDIKNPHFKILNRNRPKNL